MDPDSILSAIRKTLNGLKNYFRGESVPDPFQDKSPTRTRASRKPIPGISIPDSMSKRKIRVPGLRVARRIIAAGLFVVYLGLIYGMITAFQPGDTNNFLIWLFILTAWVLLDDLWRSRKEEKQAFES